MTITLSPGELKELNVAMQPIAIAPQLIITELFVTTLKRSYQTGADTCYHIALKNIGSAQVSGVLNLYDWQAWWGQEPGDERRWRSPTFTILPGGTFRYRSIIHQLAFDQTYFRWTVVVNDVTILETPRIYVIPGKMYTGDQKIAVGECTYKAPGIAVVWYSQYSECNTWDGNIHTPEFRPYLHDIDWGTWRTGNYGSTVWWPAIFIPIIDPQMISGATYYAYISGGGAGAAWREVWFQFTAA